MADYGKVSLSIYEITVNKKGDRSKDYVISDFNNGSDLWFFFKDCMESWCTTNTSLIEDKESQKILKLKRKSDGNTFLIPSGRTLSGVYESGDYGDERDVIDVISGEQRYTQDVNDAPVIPFYFLFVLNKGCTSGFLILQRFRQSGVFTICEKAFQEAFRNKHEDFMLRIKPFSSTSVVQKYLEVCQLKEVILKDVTYDKISKTTVAQSIDVDPKICHLDMVLKASKRSFLTNKDALKNKKYVSIEGLEYADTEFKIKIGERERTVTSKQIEQIGTFIDITDYVKWGNNKMPTYESIHKEATELLSDMISDMKGN